VTGSEAPAIVALPAEVDASTATQIPDQISAACAADAALVIVDLTAVSSCDPAAVRYLLKAHRRAAVSGCRVRFAVRPGGPLQRIADFGDSHPLLAVYPTLYQAMAGGGRAPDTDIPPGLT
jgi:anti-anti-sigma factor